jgi:TRAP-type C4-dicarboxylate transport system permease small subunit
MAAVAWAAVGVAREQWDELMSTLDWSVGWFIVPIGIGAGLSALHLLRIAIYGPPRPAAGAAE